MSSQAAPSGVPLSLSEHLQAVTEALAAVHAPKDVFEIVLTPALQALEAIAGAVLLVDQTGERLEIARTQGYEEGAQTLWQDGPLDDNVPAGDALKRYEPLFFEQQGALVRAYPELEARTGGVAAVATAVLPMFLDGQPLGAIILDFQQPHHFTPEEQRFLQTLAAQCAIALGRARLTASLQRQVQERTHQLLLNTHAQDVFVEFAEAVGTQTDVLTLAQQAVAVLKLRFPECSSGYYELDEHRWKLRVHTEDLNTQPELRQTLQEGLPRDTPSFAQALETGRPVFLENWDAAEGQIQQTEAYGAVANYPLALEGEVHAILSIGLRSEHQWAKRDRAVFRAVGRSLTLALERTEQARRLEIQNAELEARTLALERFAQLARSPETDAATLIRQVQETVHELIGEGFAVYYELEGHAWHLRSQVGSPEDATIQASLESALSYETVLNFRLPWERGAPFYQDAYDPALDQGVPGTAGLASTAALPVWVGTRRQGLFGYGLKVSHPWTRADRAILETAVNSLGLSLERAERARVLEAERASLDAFVRFTEQSTHTTDTLRLAQEAKDVLTATLSVEVGYSELEDRLWKGRIFAETTPPEVVAQARRGFPADLPSFARPFEEGDVVFADSWNPQGAEHTEVYGAVALYPYFQRGEPHGLLTMGTSNVRAWTERERLVFRSVGRSLALAFERAEQTARQEHQTAELEARTRALEGFANLTRDLSVEVDPYVLIERAQTMVLSLLPEGYALYFELEGDRWVLHAQTGDLRSAALQAVATAGLPYEEANNLLIPFHTRTPYYQNQYARHTDNLDSLVAHLGASATLPVLVNGQVRGVFAVVLFGGARSWTPPDQAALEAVVRSLGLALERVEGIAELEARSREVSRWRERYEVAVQGSGDLLYDWDPATDVIVYGGAVEQITGYGVQELKGNLADWTERLIHPDDREPFAQEIARVIASGGEAHVAFRLLHKDGSLREVEDDGYFKRDAQGEVTQMVGFVRDVTERNQAERALLQLNEELRRSNEELEQFAYIASHDLQAPIRAVTSFAGVIGKRYGDRLDERGRMYLQQIMDGGEHMKRLVDDLLTFSRVHTEQRPPVPTDTERVFDTVASRLQTEVPGAAITRGELPVVQADGAQLDQLLQNLIGNGLKYRRAEVTPEVQVSAERDGEFWRFAVSDNGIGVEPQYFERIFEIFQRLHGRERFEGTGIGLAVCKKIVERHGGRLWLESIPGQGSTFFFTLPEV